MGKLVVAVRSKVVGVQHAEQDMGRVRHSGTNEEPVLGRYAGGRVGG